MTVSARSRGRQFGNFKGFSSQGPRWAKSAYLSKICGLQPGCEIFRNLRPPKRLRFLLEVCITGGLFPVPVGSPPRPVSKSDSSKDLSSAARGWAKTVCGGQPKLGSRSKELSVTSGAQTSFHVVKISTRFKTCQQPTALWFVFAVVVEVVSILAVPVVVGVIIEVV